MQQVAYGAQVASLYVLLGHETAAVHNPGWEADRANGVFLSRRKVGKATMLLGGVKRFRQGALETAVAHCVSGVWFFCFFGESALQNLAWGQNIEFLRR